MFVPEFKRPSVVGDLYCLYSEIGSSTPYLNSIPHVRADIQRDLTNGAMWPDLSLIFTDDRDLVDKTFH